jgi:hypothetical protein
MEFEPKKNGISLLIILFLLSDYEICIIKIQTRQNTESKNNKSDKKDIIIDFWIDKSQISSNKNVDTLA